VVKKKNDKDPIFGSTLSTKDIARYCGVSVVHVSRWIKDGKLKCYRYPGGRYKISKESFREFLKNNDIPIVESFFEDFEDKETKKILIGEDEYDFAIGLRETLRNEYPDYEIEVAKDGYEVLIKMGEFRPDLLILDIRIPKIDGLEVCRRLKEDESGLANTKIIAITGHSKSYRREDVLNSGANEYLLKPFKITELLIYIEKFIGAKSS